MASLCLNSLPLPPSSQPRRVLETSLSSVNITSSSNGHLKGETLKPIVVCGSPPTFVSAPGRRIVAGQCLQTKVQQYPCFRFFNINFDISVFEFFSSLLLLFWLFPKLLRKLQSTAFDYRLLLSFLFYFFLIVQLVICMETLTKQDVHLRLLEC